MNNQSFDEYLIRISREVREKQETFRNLYRIDDYQQYYYSQSTGVFTFLNTDADNIFFDYQEIGTIALKPGTWLWSWSNSSIYERVKISSRQLREYGLENNIQKLTQNTWSAEEIDGWEMLSVAYDILNPLGLYRFENDNLLRFIILREKITEKDAQEGEEELDKLLKCENYGYNRASFVCEHILNNIGTGFHEAFETQRDMDLSEDDNFQAWCDDCEKNKT